MDEDQKLLQEGDFVVKPCGWLEKLCYGLGHVYNDLCAAVWFSYTLFYLQIILQMESSTAGLLMMIGQIADSLATPAAGWAVDRTDSRRVWHLAGTVAVAIGFTLIFSIRWTVFNTDAILYYVTVIILFQIGWAVIQISHLSIIPYVARDHTHSSELTAIRYTASVCCNITVYLITLFILKTNQPSTKIGPDDFYKFKEIAWIITCVGLFATLAFYCGIKTKPPHNQDADNESQSTLNLNGNGRRHLLKTCGIYQVAIMYMASRLFTTLNLVYIPLYLDETYLTTETGDIRQMIASVPLVSFITSFVTSLVLKYRSKQCTDKVAYFLGSLLSLTGCAWVLLGNSTDSRDEIYGIAALIGMGGSATMVASLCMTAAFVKTKGYGGGSVYSTVTFTDKLISGAVVIFIQHLQCKPKELCPHFYRHVLGYVCGSAALLGLVSLITLRNQSRIHYTNI